MKIGMNQRLGRMSVLILAFACAASASAEQKSREQRRAAQEIYWSSGDEPPSMDPTKQADTVSAMWLGHIYEGLMTYDQSGNVVLGTAEKMDISADKKTYTFKIRKTAKWHDGKAVTAHDFEYSLKRLVDPAYASEYAFIAAVASIENAEEITAKKKPVDSLGVKVVDDHTLEIKLTRPVPFFDSLMAFQIFYPVRKDVVEKFGPKFATVAESIVGNGPFKVASWSREQSMRLEKAPTYWNAKAIKLAAIESPAMVKDTQANFNNFQTGGIDFTRVISPEVIKQAQDAKLKINTFPSGCLAYMELNTREGKLFSNADLRKAMEIGINRNEFVSKIVGVPGYKPAFGIVPDYMPGSKAGTSFRKEAPLSLKDADIMGAKKHIDAYTKASGQAKIPGFTILAGDSTRAKKYAEYWQSTLAKLYSTEVKIETVPFKTRLQKTRDGQFDLVLAGWCPDYRDAMTFADLFTSKNENNNTGWKSPKVDEAIEAARNEVDLAKRIKLINDAEKVLLEEAPIVVTDQSGEPYITAEGLKGVRRGQFGVDPDFRYANWDSSVAKK